MNMWKKFHNFRMKNEREINCGNWMNNWDEHEQLAWQLVKARLTEWQSCK